MSSTSRCGLALADSECSTPMAILADGAAGSMLEMDDVHRDALLHPAPVVIPAALGAARATGSQVRQLLAGIVAGYEIMIRIGRSMGTGHYRYWHPSSTCGAFGAASAAGRVLGLDKQQTVSALGNAGSRTGGLWQMRHEPVPTKAMHTALAAHSGWLAADLAARGFAGPRTLLEGDQGLLAATAPNAEPARMLEPAEDWLLHQVSFKPWPACRHAHPAIDALLALEPNLAAEDVNTIRVKTFQAAIDFCDNATPHTQLQARFSIQHALAAALVHGRPALEHYEDAVIGDPRVANLRSRISVGADEHINARFPAHYGARVEVRRGDGSVVKAGVADAWGDPECPLSDEELADKARGLMRAAGWQPAAIERIINSTLSLDPDDDLLGWLALIEEAAG